MALVPAGFSSPPCLLAWCLAGAAGCNLIFPDVSHQPVVHNPFPQLSRVAVAPFFNQSDEPTVDGRKFALAYFAELQAVPGFEVVPLGVVEEAIIEHQVDLSRAGEARRLAKILGVDAVVIGSVTDYTPYYPPRCGLRVEWYAANPGFHEIPPGYGLPWGTPEEEFIPAPLVFEAEMALAQAQMATQTPACDTPLDPAPLPMPPQSGPALMTPLAPPAEPARTAAIATRRKPETDAPPAAPSEPGASGARRRTVCRRRRPRSTKKSCRRAPAANGSRLRRRCNRTRLPSLLRPVRSAPTARCRPVGRTSAVSFRPAEPGAPALLAAQWSGYDAHADLSRQRQRIYRSAGQLLSLPRRCALRRLAELPAAQRRLHSLLLSHAHLGNALGARRRR